MIQFLIFFDGAMSLTMSIGQLMDRNKSTFNYMLAAFLFSAGVCQMYNGLKVSGLLIAHPHFAFVYVPFLYFTSPAFFFCFKSLTGTHYRLQWKDALHLVPLFIIMVSLIPFYALEAETKRAILMTPPLLQDSNPLMSYYTVIVFIVVVAVLAYLVVFIKNTTFLWNLRYLKLKKYHTSTSSS